MQYYSFLLKIIQHSKILFIYLFLGYKELDNSVTEKSSVTQTEGELEQESTCAESAHMGSLGVQLYSLISYIKVDIYIRTTKRSSQMKH